MILIILLSTLVYSSSYESFIVTIDGGSTFVQTPDKFVKKTSLIVSNKTILPIWAKIESSLEKKDIYVTIPRQKSISVDLIMNKGEYLSLIPLAPASQKLLLKFGSKKYEIPPKRKH